MGRTLILRILVKGGQNTEIHNVGMDLKVFVVGILKFEFNGKLNSRSLRFNSLLYNRERNWKA